MLLTSNFQGSSGARTIPSSVPSTMRPASEDYVKMKPVSSNIHGIFHGKEVKDCLPKGFRRASAPSRFVNSQTLGGCSNNPRSKKP